MTTVVVGIVCALAVEARHLGPATWLNDQIGSLQDGTLLVVSGMGSLAAARAARALVDAGANALASWGMAGGLDPSLAAGAIFLPSEVVAPATPAVPTETLATAAPWRDRLRIALRSHRPITQGKLLTCTEVIDSPQRKAALFRDTHALAVDMESVHVARVAAHSGLPFVAIRVIVDGAADSIPPPVASATDSTGRVRLQALLLGLSRQPGSLGPLLRLACRYRRASRSLAAIARTGSVTSVLAAAAGPAA